MVVRKDDVHLKNLIQTLFESFSKDNFNDIKSRYGKVELIFGFNKRKTIMYNLVIVVALLRNSRELNQKVTI